MPRRIVGLDEKVVIGGRNTTILDEIRRQTPFYEFTLRKVRDSQTAVYLVDITKGSFSYEFDISKADYIRLMSLVARL